MAEMGKPSSPDELDSTPTIRVTVYRDGELVHRECCQTDAEASAVLEQWHECDAIVFEVEEGSVRHRPPGR